MSCDGQISTRKSKKIYPVTIEKYKGQTNKDTQDFVGKKFPQNHLCIHTMS